MLAALLLCLLPTDFADARCSTIEINRYGWRTPRAGLALALEKSKEMIMAEPDRSIELFSTDDLLDELLVRFEHAVFSGLKSPGTDMSLVVRRWVGNHATCAGLGQSVALAALQDFEERANK